MAFNSCESKRITIKHSEIQLKSLSHSGIITIAVITDAVHIMWASFELRAADWHSDTDTVTKKKKEKIEIKFEKIKIKQN